MHVDFETASKVDLRKAGVWRYAEDPSTFLLCMSWAIDDGPIRSWKPGDKLPVEFLDHVRSGGEVHAWNAVFEIAIWQLVGVKQGLLPAINVAQFRDTMASAAYWGLPLSLDQAAHAIGARFLKDKAGHALMLRMSRPRSIDKKTGAVSWWHEDDPARYKQLIDYNRQDVAAERNVSQLIPDLPREELDVWRADFAINRRGVKLDQTLIDAMKRVMEREKTRLDSELETVTGGAVTAATQVKKLTEWVSQWATVQSLDKAGIAQLLSGATRLMLPGEAVRALEIRQEASKSSTSKLNAMLACVCSDGRVRGLMQYYGAFRTGRWAGRLVQIQNLPRPTTKHTAQLIALMLAGTDVSPFISPLEAVSSCIRGCFVADTGKILTQNDLSQIEARVVAWLAGQDDILEVFKRGDDVYTYTALKAGSNDRQFGKVLVLACGFGMGGGKFQETAEGYGVVLAYDEADEAVRVWRENNPKIVRYWKLVQETCVRAIKNPGGTYSIGPLGRQVKIGVSTKGRTKGCLLIQLPSGRYLTYRNAALESGQYGPEITYMGLNQYNRKWERLRTYGGKLVENITQAAARDVLARATVQIERTLPGIVMSVHDELVHESMSDLSVKAKNTLASIMDTPPSWAPDLPVASDGWQGQRYRK